jgi:two-component system sensor histidine kinase YesM
MLFAVLAQRSVTRSINKPIRELENLSSQIAAGNLSARADIPDVMELDNLTLNLNIMAEKIKELIDTNIEEQKNRQKSEMKALQAQITPHFLYNTLDTIIWLAEGKQYDQVISVTRNFASFFRTSLNKGNEWTTVQNELEHVRNYLAIQKIRYRDILEFSIICDDAMGDKQMLKLLLQPLVENALYHGIKNKRGRGRLAVRGWQEDGFLCFSVDDDGIGVSSERLKDIKVQLGCEPSNSAVTDIYGLYNVNRRLALYYNNKASMEISSMYKQGTSVSFRLPEIANV